MTTSTSTPQYRPAPWDPAARRRRPIFLWVYFAVQALFVSVVVYLLGDAATADSLQKLDDVVRYHYAIAAWLTVDVLLGTSYGVYRLARNP